MLDPIQILPGKSTPWRPCRSLRGYEWRLNASGELERRLVQIDAAKKRA